MSALFIVLQRDVPDFDPYVNGKSLSKEERRLHKIAKKQGVTPLMDFFSMDPEEVKDLIYLESDQNEQLDAIQPEGWFKPSEGLQTVTALINAIQQDMESVHDSEGVLAELEEWKHVLRKADSQDLYWHVAVDY
ncbi:MAG: hypothetical protein AAF085_06490 [Planctomycetota bacterium]